MKKHCLLIVMFAFFAFAAKAQELKEINGIYYADSVAYTGKYITHFPNGKNKIEMNLENGMKNGTVNVYFENGQLNEVRSYKNNLMHGSWITYNEQNGYFSFGFSGYSRSLTISPFLPKLRQIPTFSPML